MDEIIKDVVKNVLERNAELRSDTSEFSQGKRMAYYEIVDMINNRLTTLGYSPEDFGIISDPFVMING